MSQCKHRYQKFDDVSLFCEKCGDRKVIAPVPGPVFVPMPWYPSTWYWRQSVPAYPYITWNDTGTSTITTSTFILNGGITYDAQS